MIADGFSDPIRGVRDHHRDGYNFLRLDGSGEYYRDDNEELLNLNGGSLYNTNPYLLEIAWETFRIDELATAPYTP